MTTLQATMAVTEEREQAAATVAAEAGAPGFQRYYEEAGPDYQSWSRDYNMHFGYYRWGMNPLGREGMLEQMNREILGRLRVSEAVAPRILDMGCGLGATLRSMARLLPRAELTGLTLVPWQVEQGRLLNETDPSYAKIDIDLGDYEHTAFAPASFDGVYALESSCYAHGQDKAAFLKEAHRLLRPGGRLVIADGFLKSGGSLSGFQEAIYGKLCECWVIETLGDIDRCVAEMTRLGFTAITVEPLQYRVAPSVFQVPWVTAKFLITDVLFGERRMTRARWNNVLAPLLLPFLGYPVGPMLYCMIGAEKV